MAKRLTDQERMYRSVTEATVLQNTSQRLHYRGAFAWRNNSGGFTTDAGQFVRFGKRGSADILGVAPDGRFLAVETKTETGILSQAQEQFLAEVRQRGGIALVARPSNYQEVIDQAFMRETTEGETPHATPVLPAN